MRPPGWGRKRRTVQRQATAASERPLYPWRVLRRALQEHAPRTLAPLGLHLAMKPRSLYHIVWVNVPVCKIVIRAETARQNASNARTPLILGELAPAGGCHSSKCPYIGLGRLWGEAGMKSTESTMISL
jgi:hypothetical protein